MPSFSDLIKIGNRAKGIGQWEAANLAFGLALKDYFDFLFMGGEGEVPRIHIETGDTIGSNSGEVFYDLLTI
ncbi:MAG: hypothetical protein Q7S70_00205, partial [bacterium]|nr:hypothetical protein [bacterium]